MRTIAVKRSSKRFTVPYASGRLLQGRYWDYRICSVVKGDGTHTSATFKAEVIPHKNTPNAPKWASIKTAYKDNPIARENLDRERQAYLLPDVASSPCFRKLYDVMKSNGENDQIQIAFEWLDTTLAELKYEPGMRTYGLIKKVLDAALKSCVILDRQAHVNTDVSTNSAYAKVGDLGLAQPFAMRAPEVFLGQACTEKSQVWAIAAMLLIWIKPGTLGVWDSPHFLMHKDWSMAKIKRLFPGWNLPAPHEIERETLAVAVESAGELSEGVPELQAILPFEEELQNVEVPGQLSKLLVFMLVLDPEKRPSASNVLQSEEFREFGEFVND